jgi:hypothetical protein
VRSRRPGRLLQRPALRGERRVVARGEPPVREGFLDNDPEPGGSGFLQRRAGRGLKEVPRRLHAVEEAFARRDHAQCSPHGLSLARAGDREADLPPRAAQPGQLVERRAVFQHPALECGRVNLVQAQVGPQEFLALGRLAAEGTQRVVLDLVPFRLDVPLGGVGVAPLRPDSDGAGGDLPRSEPAGEEGFRPAVRASGVEVADAYPPGGIEHGVRVRLHRGDVRGGREVRGVAQVDVTGPAECRQAQPDTGDSEAGPAESPQVHGSSSFRTTPPCNAWVAVSRKSHSLSAPPSAARERQPASSPAGRPESASQARPPAAQIGSRGARRPETRWHALRTRHCSSRSTSLPCELDSRREHVTMPSRLPESLPAIGRPNRQCPHGTIYCRYARPGRDPHASRTRPLPHRRPPLPARAAALLPGPDPAGHTALRCRSNLPSPRPRLRPGLARPGLRAPRR